MSTPPILSVVMGGADNPAAHTTPPLRRVRAGTGQPGPLSKNVESLVDDAYAFGEAYGQRQGYTGGWRYGVIATAMGAALVAVAAGWIA